MIHQQIIALNIVTNKELPIIVTNNIYEPWLPIRLQPKATHIDKLLMKLTSNILLISSKILMCHQKLQIKATYKLKIKL